MKKNLLFSLAAVFALGSCIFIKKYAVTYSTGSNYTLSGPVEVKKGEEFDFDLVYTAGYQGELLVTGASYQQTASGYHVYDVAEDVFVNVNNVSKIKYDVSKTTNTTYTIDGNDQVEYGDDYSFTVNYQTGYKGTVKVNGNVVEPVDNVFTVSEVKENLSISVEPSLKQMTIVKPETEGKKFSFTGVNKVDYGTDYTFVVEFDEGYTGTVKANGIALTAEVDGKTYKVSEVKAMVTIVVDVNFTVSAPQSNDDYTFTGAEGGVIGEDYSFSVVFADYRKGNVLINGNPATPVDGVYTVSKVNENLTITVSDVKTNLIVLDKDHALSAYSTATSSTVERVEFNKNDVVRGVLNDPNFGEINFDVYNFQANGDNFGAWRSNNVDRFIRNIDPINGLGSIKVSQDNLTLDLGIKIDGEIIYIENGIALTKDTPYNITGEYCYFRLNYSGGFAVLKTVEIYFKDNVVESEYTKSTWLANHAIGTNPAGGEITNMCQKTCDNNGSPISDGAFLGLNAIDAGHAWADGTINGQYINTQRRTDETYTWDFPYRNFSAKDAASIRFRTSGANFDFSLDGKKIFHSYVKNSEYTVLVYGGKLYCDGNYIYTLTENQNSSSEVMSASLYVKDSYKTGIDNQYAWFGMSSYFAYTIVE